MLTLTLAFCVILLVYEMMQQGQNPLAISNPPLLPPPQSVPPLVEHREMREIPLYFASTDSRLLVGELRSVPMSPHTVDNCRAILEELVAGPHQPLTPIVPPSTQVHAVYLLENGELVVDFSIDLLSRQQRGASAEALMIYGIVNTLTQPEVAGPEEGPVHSVRFLVEGAPPEESLPRYSHLALSYPIGPSSDWLESRQPAQANDG
jgi:hypothetical protein